MELTGAQILIQTLIEQEVEILFGYPGGSVLNIYDALYEKRDQIRHIVASHEQGAAHAADGYARSTGKTGVVLATSGPGATNLVTGIANAFHDSVPMVAITGNVPLDLIGRDSFQEVDITGVTNPIVKHNYIVKDVDHLADIVREAFVIANSDRKGPVLVDIPKDITAAKTEFVPGGKFRRRPNPVIDEEQLATAIAAINRSERPLIYAGGGVVFNDASDLLYRFSQRIGAPVCLSMMGMSAVPSDYPLLLGMIGMHGTATANYATRRCDLLITIGARFSDRVAGNREQFAHRAEIIHIDIDFSEICKNVEIDYPVVGSTTDVLTRLLDAVEERKNDEWIHKLLDHKAHNGLPAATGDDVNPREVIQKIRAFAGEDAIIATDVGQHQMLTAQYYPFNQPRTFVSSCGLGAMGYGMGAAIGCQLGHPGRRVVMITGDGSFHMNMAEMAVAVTHNLPIVVVIMNNGVLGMVHQWQNLFYKERYSYTEINRATDFVKLAEAFGAVGLRIEHRGEISGVLEQAFACGKPCVVDCKILPSQRVYPIIPPGGTAKDMIFSDAEQGDE